jgi:hypothetical protein
MDNKKNEDTLKKTKDPKDDWFDYEAPIWEKDERWMAYLNPYKFWIYGD